MNSPLNPADSLRLDVRHLSTFFDTDEGLIRSVADVSFSIRPGQTTALVGESGSGKSVTSLTLMRLLSRTASTQVSGQALFTNRAGQTTVDMANGPVQRISPFPETIKLLEGLGVKNNHKCVGC